MGKETEILDIIENGIFIVDSNLTIHFWNNWLTVNTGISKETAQGKQLEVLFPTTKFKLLKRKIKIALKMNSSTFTNSAIDKYVIPIKLKKITTSRFQYMRQDVVITPLAENEVSIIVYDTSALLDAKATINEQLAIVQKQATTDPLTGQHNRKMFNDLLSAEISKSLRHNKTFSLVIFDIDNFKSVNDTYGHLVGDEVLIAISTISTENLRESDVFARWGGEEFVILLPETRLDGAAAVAEKVRSTIATYDCGEPGYKTCSFGVAEFNPQQDTKSLINDADKALYFAKTNGKNQVVTMHNDEMARWRPQS